MFEPERVETYRRVRAEYREVISPLIKHLTRDEGLHVGELLGLTRNGVFVFDEGGLEVAAMQDYATYEKILNDPIRVEKILQSLPESHRHYITETKDAAYSIYRIAGVDPAECRITALDCLRGEERREITDIQLSRTLSVRNDLLIGWRLVRLEGIDMTTGVLVPVAASSLPDIRRALERRMGEGHSFRAAMARIWPTTFRKRDRTGVRCEIEGGISGW